MTQQPSGESLPAGGPVEPQRFYHQGGSPWWNVVPPPPTRPTRWWKRRRAQLCVALGLVLALVGGLAIWALVPRRATPVADRAPFFLAVAALMREPAMHYSGTLPGSGASWDMESTSGGQELGSVTLDGQQVSVLMVGGETYVKPPASMLDGLLPAGVSADAVQGKWITGLDSLTNMLPSSSSTPLDLASSLFGALERSTDFPLAGAPPSEVGAAPAVSVTTPLGVLTVSASSPYRVIRVTSGAAVNDASTDAEPTTLAVTALSRIAGGTRDTRTAATASAGGARHPGIRGPTISGLIADATVGAAFDAADDGAETSLTPMSASDDSQLLSSVESATSDTAGALDAGVSTDVEGDGTLDCSTGGCVVTDDVSSTTTGAAGAQLSGTVTVHMTADVTVQGEDAGECTADSTMDINSSTDVECDDSEAGAVIAQDQEQAQEEADATGESIDQVLDCEASVEVYAEASVDEAQVEQEVTDEETEQNTDAQTAAEDRNPAPGNVSPDDATALDDAMAQVDAESSDAASAAGASPGLASDLEQLGSSGSYNILLGISSPAFENLTRSENLENLMSFTTQDARDLFLMILYGNPDANWSVSLDGFSGDTVESKFMSAVQVGLSRPNNSVTQWEMAELYNVKGFGRYGNSTLGDVTFYENGGKVPNPWATSKG